MDRFRRERGSLILRCKGDEVANAFLIIRANRVGELETNAKIGPRLVGRDRQQEASERTIILDLFGYAGVCRDYGLPSVPTPLRQSPPEVYP